MGLPLNKYPRARLLRDWWKKHGAAKRGVDEPRSVGQLIHYINQQGRDQGKHVVSQLMTIAQMIWVIFVVYRGTPDEEEL